MTESGSIEDMVKNRSKGLVKKSLILAWATALAAGSISAPRLQADDNNGQALEIVDDQNIDLSQYTKVWETGPLEYYVSNSLESKSIHGINEKMNPDWLKKRTKFYDFLIRNTVDREFYIDELTVRFRDECNTIKRFSREQLEEMWGTTTIPAGKYLLQQDRSIGLCIDVDTILFVSELYVINDLEGRSGRFMVNYTVPPIRLKQP